MGKLITPEVWGKKGLKIWSPAEGARATVGSATNFAPLWRLPEEMRRNALGVGKTDKDRYLLCAGGLVVSVFFPDTTNNKRELPVLVVAVSNATEDRETAIDTLQVCQLVVRYTSKNGLAYKRRFWIPSATVESMHVEDSVRSGNMRICRLWTQLYDAGNYSYRKFSSIKEIAEMSFVRADGREYSTELKEYSLESSFLKDGALVSASCSVSVEDFVDVLSDDE